MSDNVSPYRYHLSALGDELKNLGLNALLVPHDDEYLSYELTPDCERLAFLTGFTGSAGLFLYVPEPPADLSSSGVALADGRVRARHRACVLVDGRYVVQVAEQIDPQLFDSFDLHEVRPEDWLRAMLPRGARVGIDLRTISYRAYVDLRDKLSPAGLELVDTNGNLADKIWDNRPDPVFSKLEIYPDEYNGCPSMEKRKNLARALQDGGYDATIIGDPETVCWLLNIRGADRPHLPVVNCRLVAYANETLEWYIDDRHLDPSRQEELESHFGHIDIFPEQSFSELLERLSNAACRVYVDESTLNAAIMTALQNGGATVREGLGLCALPKAVKNDLELAGEHQAHLKDGVAMCRFLAWLDDLTGFSSKSGGDKTFLKRVKDFDEATLAERAEAFRKVEDGYRGPSFSTISALGPNAAMCHYNYLEVHSPRPLGSDPLYLIDSGAHFSEGTTDITRTVLVGPGLSEELKRLYTLVLKAHIALSTAIFPPGTSGHQLDALARRPLWDQGLDYAHGTGHGVGHLLAVHEGPQSISVRPAPVALQPGMVISIEPGYYSSGLCGIRLENLVCIEQCTRPSLEHMLCFNPLTMVPFDLRLIMKEMLTQRERNWLNDYHHTVRTQILSEGTTLNEMEVAWLERATAPI